MINEDAEQDWFAQFRQDHPNVQLPIMKGASEAFDTFRLGWQQFRTVAPMYIVIDKHGIVRHRSNVRGSITVEEVKEMVEGLLAEE
jgi:hypothetical protein